MDGDNETEDNNIEMSVCNQNDYEQEIYFEDDEHLYVRMRDSDQNQSMKPMKRAREEEGEDVEKEEDGLEAEGKWTEIVKTKKLKPTLDKIELYISSAEKLPKQFALAKLFRECGLTEIIRIKYVNPFKLRVDTKDEASADKILNCKCLTDKGWRIQKALEKNLTYGVIRDVDLDLSDEEILNSVECPKPGQLVAARRLKRRNTENNEWIFSESVRLCFKGSYLPLFVKVNDIRISVMPYTFPVNQCTRCWRLGHVTSRCPANKIVCPKCAGEHANCEAKKYKCVNCKGDHLALSKTCPAFIKEKRLRELMVEFNCTYRKALTIYVTPDSPVCQTPQVSRTQPPNNTMSYFSILSANTEQTPNTSLQHTPSFADVVKKRLQTTPLENRRPMRTAKRTNSHKTVENDDFPSIPSFESVPIVDDNQPTSKENEIKFTELLQKLKDILFLREITMKSKISSMIKCCFEWVILVVVENMSDCSVIKSVVNYFLSDNSD